MKKEKRFTFSAQQIAIVAMLMALRFVLSKFSIPLGESNRIGFGFIVVSLMGMLYGPWVTGIASGLFDLLKSFVGSVGGTFFIGFTLSAIAGGVVYGFFLHRQRVNWQHVLGAVVTNTVLVNLLMTTYWIHLLYGTPFKALFIARIPQNLVMGAVRFMMILLLSRLPQIKQIIQKYRTD